MKPDQARLQYLERRAQYDEYSYHRLAEELRDPVCGSTRCDALRDAASAAIVDLINNWGQLCAVLKIYPGSTMGRVRDRIAEVRRTADQ